MSVYKLFNRAYRDYVRNDETLKQLNLIILAVAIGTLLFTAQGGVAFTGFASALGAGEFAFGLFSHFLSLRVFFKFIHLISQLKPVNIKQCLWSAVSSKDHYGS